jgi:hypothetical protein
MFRVDAWADATLSLKATVAGNAGVAQRGVHRG